VVGILLALALIAGVHGTAVELAARDARYQAAVGEAALLAKAIANDERGYLLSGGVEFLAQMDERVARAREAFARAEAAAHGANLVAITAARAGFEQWLEQLGPELRAAQTGDRPAAVATAMGPSRSLRKAYEASLAEAHDLAGSAVEASATSVTVASFRATAILLAYVAIAITISAAVGLWVVRAVMRPAYRLLHLLTATETVAGPS
jgi:methyl-accepting chemotaxis protein